MQNKMQNKISKLMPRPTDVSFLMHICTVINIFSGLKFLHPVLSTSSFVSVMINRIHTVL